MATKRLQKTILLFAVALLLAIAPIFSVNLHKASAALTVSDYFTNATTVLEDDSLKVTVDDQKSATFKRNLVTGNFQTAFKLTSNVDNLEFSLKYDAYYVNGTSVEDGKITNSVVLDAENGKFYWKNDDTDYITFAFDLSKEIKLSLTVVNNNYTVKIENDGVVKSLVLSDANYKTKVVDKAVATIGLKTKTSDGAVATVAIRYIDQDNNGVIETYKQYFTLNTEGEINSYAKPIVTVGEEFAVKNGNTFERFLNTRYNLDFNVYYVCQDPDSSVSSNDITVNDATGVTVYESGSNAYVIFADNFGTAITNGRTGSIDLVQKSDKTKSFRTLTVNAYDAKKVDVDSDDDAETGNDAAPVYNYDVTALNNYKAKLLSSLKKEYDVGDIKEEHYIRLGSSEYLTLPSMEDMVYDEYCNYDSLTFTVYYYTPSNSTGTSSSMRIPVTEAGTYRYFVVFKDDNNNEMWKKDFLKYDGDTVIGIADKYQNYVFEFTLLDDAPTSVTASTQEKAYVGLEYTANQFTIEASEYNTKYNLYYSEDNVNWSKAITNSTDLKEPDKSEYTSGCATDKEYYELKDWYEYCKEIKYNGSLTFTPNKVGYYKIECVVSTKIETVSDSIVINVTGTPDVVTPDTHWFQNNIWSILFLSIGTLALVGIILLLVIKPKND